MIRLKLIGDYNDLRLLLDWCAEGGGATIVVEYTGLNTAIVQVAEANLARFEEDADSFDIVVDRL